MGLGVALFLIAVGAILTWGVEATVQGLDINTIGVILMVVGAFGAVLSLAFWDRVLPSRRNRTTVVEERRDDVV